MPFNHDCWTGLSLFDISLSPSTVHTTSLGLSSYFLLVVATSVPTPESSGSACRVLDVCSYMLDLIRVMCNESEWFHVEGYGRVQFLRFAFIGWHCTQLNAQRVIHAGKLNSCGCLSQLLWWRSERCVKDSHVCLVDIIKKATVACLITGVSKDLKQTLKTLTACHFKDYILLQLESSLLSHVGRFPRCDVETDQQFWIICGSWLLPWVYAHISL